MNPPGRGAPVVLAAASVAVLLALAGCTAAPAPTSSAADAGGLDIADQIMPDAPAGTLTRQVAPAPAANPTSIHGLLAWDAAAGSPSALSHDHVPGPVHYVITPPVGGPHNAVWMNAGVYTEPIPSERAVHNLEHGAVWITYRPSMPAAQVAALRAFVSKQSTIPEPSVAHGQANRYIDLSPWASDALPATIVISSWGYQLRLTSPSDPRLQAFVDTFRNSRTYTPEYGAPVDGVPVQTGGRPAMDGGVEPNPAGAVAN